MTVRIKIEEEGKAPILVWTEDLDSKASEQLKNLSSLPFIFHHIAVMPDVHAGMGATIGSVIPTVGAVIPAAVGVDIGCGMLAVKLNMTGERLDERARRDLFNKISNAIPLGLTQRDESKVVTQYAEMLRPGYDQIMGRDPEIVDPMKTQRWDRQIGTLGSGNHFIEICEEGTGELWIMLHSGSRGIGNLIASHFIRKAVELNGADLPDKYLGYLEEGTDLFDRYMFAAQWAQEYAFWNRQAMLADVMACVRKVAPEAEFASDVVNCHHNFVQKEEHFGKEIWVTRKGATRAGKDELGIIPGSMGRESYIVRGLGNPDSFESSSHGAGRRLSRTAAMRKFTVEDLASQTEGVVCRRSEKVLDEIPGAYKDISTVMANQSDLVEPIHRIKQIICVKG